LRGRLTSDDGEESNEAPLLESLDRKYFRNPEPYFFMRYTDYQLVVEVSRINLNVCKKKGWTMAIASLDRFERDSSSRKPALPSNVIPPCKYRSNIILTNCFLIKIKLQSDRRNLMNALSATKLPDRWKASPVFSILF
jgi:hypothetical protein